MLISKIKLNKIISFSFLVLFLVSFVLPTSVFAATVSISTKNSTISTSEAATISAYIQKVRGRDVYFSSTPSGTFTTSPCHVNNYGSGSNGNDGTCTVAFASGTAGTYKITATEQYNGSVEATSAPIIITVTGALNATVKSPININETTPITVTTSNGISGAGTVILFTQPTGAVLSGGTACSSTSNLCCTADYNGSCNISFSSATSGTYSVGYKAINGGYKTGAISITVGTAVAPVSTVTDYYPLAPLPGVGTCDANGQNCVVKTTPTCSGGKCVNTGFANYFNAMINLFIGLCAVLAMIMIVMGGIEHMTSESVSGKSEGMKKVTNAILGLLLALGSYAILNTINPDLLKIALNLPQATITINPNQVISDNPNAPSTYSPTDLTGSGVTCTKSGGTSAFLSTVNSFKGHVTYTWANNPPWGYDATKNTIYSDCSNFVNVIYNCLGLAAPGGNANMMMGSAEKITSMDVKNGIVNGTALQPGDILGWVSGTWNDPLVAVGHVVMSTGGTGTVEVDGEGEDVSKTPPVFPTNTAVHFYTLSTYGDWSDKFGQHQNFFTNIIRVEGIGQASKTGSDISCPTNNPSATSASCKKLTSGYCAPSNLSAFGSGANGMSMICNMESGGNPSLVSGTDLCNGPGGDNTPFSFGLFQINLLSNGPTITNTQGQLCGGLFVRASDGTDLPAAGAYCTSPGIYDCKLKSGALAKYNSCKDALLNPIGNIANAVVLFKKYGMAPWNGDASVCPCAFDTTCAEK